MLIDWLTLKICSSKIPPSVLSMLRADANTIICVNPDGSVEWETISRVNIKSDSHQLNISCGGFVVITGSPARFMPDKFELYDNVFGSLDIVYCAELMLGHIEKTLGLILPLYKDWDLSRIDVTQNYFLKKGAFDIERILNHWRQSDMGKYKTATYDDSIYWQKGNRIQAGKAYYKGKQIIKDFRKRIPQITEMLRDDYCFDDNLCQLALDKVCEDETLNDFQILEKTKNIHSVWDRGREMGNRIKLSQHLLRLEACFGSRYWNEKSKKTGQFLYRLKKWYNYTPKDLKKMFDEYFDTRLGKGIDMKDINDLKNKFVEASVRLGWSETLGKNAYKTLSLVKQLGKHQVYSKNNNCSLVAKSTFNKHKRVALEAGLTMADFETGVIIPFKRESLDFIVVDGWSEIERLVS